MVELRYVLLVNKQGQTRLAKYLGEAFPTLKERAVLEGELIRRCLVRTERQCNFFDHGEARVVYRRYASLYFIVGAQSSSGGSGRASVNELGVLEFIHNLVETMDKYFENICELDIMFNLEKAHFIIDEMLAGNTGQVLTTNRGQVLQPLVLMDKHAGGATGAGGVGSIL